MRKVLLGCALLALAAGCATTSPAAAPQKRTQVRVVEMSALGDGKLSPDKTYICEEGMKTGSKRPSAICQSLRDRDLEREATQAQLQRMMQSGSARP